MELTLRHFISNFTNTEI